MEKRESCRHCGKEIRYAGGVISKWLHRASGSVYCDASATVMAAPA